MKRQTTSMMLFTLMIMLVMVTAACGQKELIQSDTVTGAGNGNGTVEEGVEGKPDNNATGEQQSDHDSQGNAEQGKDKEQDKPVTEGSGVSDQPEGTPDPDAAEPNKQTIKVYVTDDELIDLYEQDAQISFNQEDEKIKAAFAALADAGDGKMSLWNKIELLDVKVDNGALTINVHIPDDARLGSGGEVLAIDAIQKTMFQFDEIQSLDIQVDGEAVESLMGHVELEHPFVKQ